eukprot:scaffold242025_cov28-Tisochrysis_lutea.AAC.1
MAEPRFTFVELFAGIGGFRLGLEALGGQCVFSCEYSKMATHVLRHNFATCVEAGDVKGVSPYMLPHHDLLVGGFPCQSFSNAGACGGFGDERGALFHEMCRLAKACQPKALLLENVRGLLTNPGAFAEVCSCLRAAGFAIRCALFDSAALLPQRRRRLFLVAFRLNLFGQSEHPVTRFAWPILPELRRSALEVLHTQEEMTPAVAQALSIGATKWAKVKSSAYFNRFPGARLLQKAALAQTLQATYRSGYLLFSQFVPMGIYGACGDTVSVVEPKQGTSTSSREPEAEVNFRRQETESSHDGRRQPAHQTELPPRFFSSRECARLMGFGEDFILPTKDALGCRLLGNAVSPPVVGAIGASLICALEGRSRERGQVEALSVAIHLVLRACPHGREPQLCWMPPMLNALVGELPEADATCTDVHALRDFATEATSTFEDDVAGHVPGADYHSRLPVGWICVRLRDVQQRVDELLTAMAADVPGTPIAAPGDAEPHQLSDICVGSRPSSVCRWPRVLPHDGVSLQATLPSPTSANKTALAGPLLRAWSRALALRCAPRLYITQH